MAGRIPQQFIDELMARVDIVEVIDSRVPLKKSGREYAACCPFHSEKTPSFTVSPEKQFYHCFGCGAHGTAIGFLMDYEHLDFVEAITELARQVGLTVPREGGGPPARTGDHEALYSVLAEADSFFRRQLREHPAAGQATGYLKQRGLSGAIAAEFGIGFAPPSWDNLARTLGAGDPARRNLLLQAGLVIKKEDDGCYDRFRERIMFPIRDRRGRVIAFGGRILADGTPKYLNSPETPVFHKGRELYGLYEARQALRQIDRLLVVEGYMDVVALAQHGIRYAVATLGTATTSDHLERIFRVVPEVVFCFDGDRAGREAATRALETALPHMDHGRQARFLFLPEGEDPDSLVRKEGAAAFEARIAEATPLSNFLFQSLMQKVDVRSVDGRARLVELSRPLLSKLPVGVFKQMLVQRLAEIVQIEPADLSRLLPGSTPAQPARSRRGPPTGKGKDHPPSPVRIAIALLLQKPALASRAGDPERLKAIDLPGVPLFARLLALLQEYPHLSTGALLERWRDTPEGSHLLKLAQWHYPVPQDGIEKEFDDTIRRLEALAAEQRWNHLQMKLQTEGLSQEEKLEWQRLLAAQHGPN